MKKMRIILIAAILIVAVICVAVYVSKTNNHGKMEGLADTTKEGVILHAFSWSFATLTESMEQIAAAGFTSVQTSPINLCYDGDPGMQLYGDGKWYYHYQPTDWTIGNYH